MNFSDLEILKLSLHLEREREENRRFIQECLAVIERRKSSQPIPHADRRAS